MSAVCPRGLSHPSHLTAVFWSADPTRLLMTPALLLGHLGASFPPVASPVRRPGHAAHTRRQVAAVGPRTGESVRAFAEKYGIDRGAEIRWLTQFRLWHHLMVRVFRGIRKHLPAIGQM